MIRNTTLRDIARRLNLSIATVSRALRNHPAVSLDRKNAVRKLAEELNYPIESRYQERKGQPALGVILPALHQDHYSGYLEGIEAAAEAAGFATLACSSNGDPEREALAARALGFRRVEGFLVSQGSGTIKVEHFRKLMDGGTPVVFIDQVPAGNDFSTVEADEFEGALQIVDHLVRSGYRRIAYLAGPGRWGTGRRRLKGFRRALEGFGLPWRAPYVIPGGLDEVDGIRGYRKLIGLEEKPDAVLAANASVALGVYISCNLDGLRIPLDMAIAAFSDNPLANLLTPPLTTVSLPTWEMGRVATDLLIGQVRNGMPAGPVTRICKPRLAIRRSTRWLEP